MVYRPEKAATPAPLVLLYHGTGMAPDVFVSWLDALSVADRRGFILVAPAAKDNRMGEPSDPDHWEPQPYATGWNLSDRNPETNDDVQLTRAIIAGAARSYGIDLKRVYALGFSNGGFFAPFVSLLLNTQIAGFAESAGGATRCANRGKVGEQWVGRATNCAELAREPGYPTCTGPLKPTEVPPGRIPAAFLTHYNDDTTSSVAWTCTLAEALKHQANTKILSGRGHDMPQGFLEDAWSHLSRYSLPTE